MKNYLWKIKKSKLNETNLAQYSNFIKKNYGIRSGNNFDKICKIINPDGYLIISGFNINKEHKYSTLAVENGLKTLKTFKDSPWLSIIFQKK